MIRRPPLGGDRGDGCRVGDTRGGTENGLYSLILKRLDDLPGAIAGDQHAIGIPFAVCRQGGQIGGHKGLRLGQGPKVRPKGLGVDLGAFGIEHHQHICLLPLGFGNPGGDGVQGGDAETGQVSRQGHPPGGGKADPEPGKSPGPGGYGEQVEVREIGPGFR